MRRKLDHLFVPYCIQNAITATDLAKVMKCYNILKDLKILIEAKNAMTVTSQSSPDNSAVALKPSLNDLLKESDVMDLNEATVRWCGVVRSQNPRVQQRKQLVDDEVADISCWTPRENAFGIFSTSFQGNVKRVRKSRQNGEKPIGQQTSI